MLRVVSDDITIDAKASVPSVEKKVKEDGYAENQLSSIGKNTAGAGADLGTGYNDVADYNIGDVIDFKFFGTVANNYDYYEKYYYKFTDTMADSLTLDVNSINVSYTNQKVAAGEIAAWTPITPGTQNCRIIYSDAAPTTFSVEFPTDGSAKGLKDISGITKDSVIRVQYKATLNDKAVIGLPGQVNKVDLTFSNNPNDTGTGKTPEDKVIVFTYELDGNKYHDFQSDANKLDGAKFVLTKVKDSKTLYYTGNTSEMWKTITDPLPSNNATKAEIDNFYRTQQGVKVFTSGEGGDAGKICEVKGLDDGTYTLVEIAAPDGYTAATDTEVTMTAQLELGQNWMTYEPGAALKSFTYTINGGASIPGETASDKDAIATVPIINMQGTVLPTTGGVGTTLFYVVGTLLVLAAAVLLIARRRMDAE